MEPIEQSVTALPMIAALAEEHLPVSDIAVECAFNIVTLRPSIMSRVDSLGLAPSLLALKDRPARTKMQAMLLFELCKHGGFSGPEAVSYCAHFCEHHELQPPTWPLRSLAALAQSNAIGDQSALEAAVHVVLRVTQTELNTEARVALAAVLDILSRNRRAATLLCGVECSPLVLEALFVLLDELTPSTPRGRSSSNAQVLGLQEGTAGSHKRASIDSLCSQSSDEGGNDDSLTDSPLTALNVP